MNDQRAKADARKLPLTLVPLEILEAIAVVRQYGNQKYGDPENWKTVAKERYRDATFRHFVAYLREPYGSDRESGIPHLYHMACNVAFLIALEIADGTIPSADCVLEMNFRRLLQGQSEINLMLYRVSCVNTKCACLPDTWYHDTKDEAVAAWNHRPGEEDAYRRGVQRMPLEGGTG